MGTLHVVDGCRIQFDCVPSAVADIKAAHLLARVACSNDMSSREEELQSWFDHATAKSGFDPKPEQVGKKVFIAPAQIQRVWHGGISNTQTYWREYLAGPVGRYIYCVWDKQDALICLLYRLLVLLISVSCKKGTCHLQSFLLLRETCHGCDGR